MNKNQDFQLFFDRFPDSPPGLALKDSGFWRSP